MTRELADRLRAAQSVLAKVQAGLSQHASALPSPVADLFTDLVEQRVDIEYWLGLLEARTVARQALDGLEQLADASDTVPFGSGRAKYQHVRLAAVQAYVTISWALADRIVGMVGRVLCTREASSNNASPTKLVSHFIQKDVRKKATAGLLFESVRIAFGWPIALFYAIRNHFVHDGAHWRGSDFFEGPSPAASFKVSQQGWDKVEQDARVCGVEPTFHRVGAAWPPSPRDDLRVLLGVCEQEMDDALGILLGSACGFVREHVGFMLGQDPR
jgi:hypothetical protein